MFTEDCINRSHGTGALLLRYFDGYPTQMLSNLFLNRRGEPEWDASVEVPRDPPHRSSLPRGLDIATRAYNALASRVPQCRLPLLQRPPRIHAIAPALRFAPDLLFSSAFSVAGLEAVSRLIEELPRDIPLIQQFFDFLPSASIGFSSRLSLVVRRASLLWAVTPALAAEVHRRTGRRVDVVPSLHTALPVPQKLLHREAGIDFDAVVVGNFLMKDGAVLLDRIWGECRKEVHGLGPIHWFAHERSYTAIRTTLEGNLVWGGFLNPSDLEARIAQADLSVVVTNIGEFAGDDFARYSLPTRITEPLAAGVPLFAIASPDTAVSGLIREHNVGDVSSLSSSRPALRPLINLVRDRQRRATMGDNALRYAASNMDVRAYRNSLLAAFDELATPAIRDQRPSAAIKSAGPRAKS